MSNIDRLLRYNLGIPLVWVYTADGLILRDRLGTNIARYITDFSYEYDEEGDDVCEIKLQFERVEQMDNPFIIQDSILLVRWGYLTKGGEFINSPTRKVAIRDIDAEYSTKGITMKIECTDLVSYIKSFKTTRTRKYENPNAEIAMQAIGKAEDNFLDFLKEEAEGIFKPTITYKKKSFRWDTQGNVRGADYDEKTGRYEVARVTTAIPKTFFQEFHAAKVIKGKSQAMHTAIADKLKTIGAQSGTGGPFVLNATDDTLHIHQRNFEQETFKNYEFGSGTGELISFKPETRTRKVKEDILKSAGVNPNDKSIEVSEINFADTKITSQEEVPIANNKGGIPNASLEQFLEDSREIYKHNVDNPEDQKHIPDLKYMKSHGVIKNAYGIPLGPEEQRADYRTHIPQFVTIPSKEVLSMPEFQDLVESKAADVKAQYERDQVLVGYGIEKIQRKYEASATVIGDPSLIKSKTYGFYGLANKHQGPWYATTVKHRITVGRAYECELTLLQKPSAVGLNKNHLKTKVSTSPDGNITYENDIEFSDDMVYGGEVETKQNYNDIDLKKFNENNEREYIKEIANRVEILLTEEDFTMGRVDLVNPIKKENYLGLSRPNNELT